MFLQIDKKLAKYVFGNISRETLPRCQDYYKGNGAIKMFHVKRFKK